LTVIAAKRRAAVIVRGLQPCACRRIKVPAGSDR
jgi:hypothetical protein